VLWGQRPAGVGAWATDDPLPPAEQVLRADIDVEEGHSPPQGGGRYPGFGEALKAIEIWRARYWPHLALDIAETGGGLTLIARAPESDLEDRWVASWLAIAEEGGWMLDEHACRGNGGLRLWGAERAYGLVSSIDEGGNGGEHLTLTRGSMTPAPSRLAISRYENVQGAGHLLPLVPTKPPRQPVNRTAISRSALPSHNAVPENRPGYRLAVALPASEFVEQALSWEREGRYLRQPGSRAADTAILEGAEFEILFPHSTSDANALGLDLGRGASTWGVLIGLMGGNLKLAGSVAAHFDGKADDFLDWVWRNEDALQEAAQELRVKWLERNPRAVKKSSSQAVDIDLLFDRRYTVEELGGDAATFARASVYLRTTCSATAVELMMEALRDNRS
jgi:hypothetical protein